MNHKILFFAAVTTCFLSCGKYTGPNYNAASENNKMNGGGYPESSYSEDISKLFFKLDFIDQNGTTHNKATKNMVNGKTVVHFSHEFKKDDMTFSFYLDLPDYHGIDIYGHGRKYPASITFFKKKETDTEVPAKVWAGGGSLIVQGKGLTVEITHVDAKYIDAKFDGNFIIKDASDAIIDSAKVTFGEIRAQWQR